MKNNQVIVVRDIFKRIGLASILGTVLIGLLLARFINVTPFAGIIVLSSGITLVFVVLLRKTDSLIFGWFFLTSFFYFIIYSLFPGVLPSLYYYQKI